MASAAAANTARPRLTQAQVDKASTDIKTALHVITRFKDCDINVSQCPPHCVCGSFLLVALQCIFRYTYNRGGNGYPLFVDRSFVTMDLLKGCMKLGNAWPH
jgi:hypothetical protein